MGLECLRHRHGLLPEESHEFVEVDLPVLVEVYFVNQSAHLVAEGQVARVNQTLQIRLAELVVLVHVHFVECFSQEPFVLVDETVQEAGQEFYVRANLPE